MIALGLVILSWFSLALGGQPSLADRTESWIPFELQLFDSDRGNFSAMLNQDGSWIIAGDLGAAKSDDPMTACVLRELKIQSVKRNEYPDNSTPVDVEQMNYIIKKNPIVGPCLIFRNDAASVSL